MSQPVVTYELPNGIKLVGGIITGGDPLAWFDWRGPLGRDAPPLTVQDLGRCIDRLEYLRELLRCGS